MLRSDPDAMKSTFPLGLIAALHGGPPPRELQPGIYEIPHFGSSDYLKSYDHWPELTSVHCFGVADTLEQLLILGREEIVEGPRTFLITLTTIRRRDQPPEGGWRWHKWGPYIGTQRQEHEYLFYEMHIDQVVVYHIYEKPSPGGRAWRSA